ncbi:alpha/beta fold hydrolase [Bradyrhizobium sp. CB1015]|uniref:alpha/beta fold hydrolase n=1 Tax=Bradyrhizobium sp. CB1015 TaxID=2976822 RepID=UPI0021AA63ED|nr:alpha/beta fold hydrolase [Bradyrhizobium sp. CB1015]UWU95723.1 alpha/beta fold hydrolase [Bradyrhizobium sp. CB1015]
MPFVVSRGERIHYTNDGTGPIVVLQHGFLLDAESWRRAGIVSVLAQRYRVLCVDSLGHGRSDKPTHQELYEQKQRAADTPATALFEGARPAGLLYPATSPSGTRPVVRPLVQASSRRAIPRFCSREAFSQAT